MYATWTVLLVKSLGELVKGTFRGENQFVRYETYLLLLGAIVSMPSQIRYLNAGLRHFESLFIVPVYAARRAERRTERARERERARRESEARRRRGGRGGGAEERERVRRGGGAEERARARQCACVAAR